MPKLASAVAAIGLLLCVCVGVADATTYRIKPAARSGGLLTFSVGQIPPGTVRTARVTNGNRSRRVSVQRVRSAIRTNGLLRVAGVARGARLARRTRDRLVVVVARTAAAATAGYYVSKTGSDSNPGTSTAPWRTIGRAATVAGAGSRVLVRAGTYAEDVTLSRSGTQPSPITFAADPGAAVSLRSLTFAGSNLIVSGIDVSGAGRDCVTIAPALTNIAMNGSTVSDCGRDGVHFTRAPTDRYTRDVTISKATIRRVGLTDTEANDLTIYGDRVSVLDSDLSGTPNDAINLWGDGITIRRNVIHDISNTGGRHNDALQTWTGMDDGAEGKPVTNLVVAQNIIRNISGANAHALMAEGPGHSNWKIYDNLIQRIGDQALMFGVSGDPGITGIDVYNNTFVSAGANNTIEHNGANTGKLTNNIFYNCDGWGREVPYHVDSRASIVRRHNLAGGSTTPLKETGAINSDPGFVDATSDFHLKSASPAIDAGDAGTARTHDLDGRGTVGTVDVGAYEFQ